MDGFGKVVQGFIGRHQCRQLEQIEEGDRVAGDRTPVPPGELVMSCTSRILAASDDSAEKRAVGEKWAQLSNGECLFVMAVKKDAHNRDVRGQLQALLA